MAKIEIFQFCREYFPTTLWVKNSVKIALSLTVSEILIFFVFRKNSRWPPKVAKIDFFSISHRILCFNPTGQKFCRNRSISYGFQDINIFCFSAKIQDGRVAKIETFQFCIEYFPTTLRVKNSVQIPIKYQLPKSYGF